MPTVRVDYYGVEGVGKNVTEAKQNAGHAIRKIIASLTPMIYAHRGYAVVIYPTTEPTTMCYTLLHPADDGQVYSSSHCDAEGCKLEAIKHLLSLTRAEDEYDVPDWVPKVGDFRRNLVSEWRRIAGFQKAYRKAVAMGETDPHRWACEHTTEFMT